MNINKRITREQTNIRDVFHLEVTKWQICFRALQALAGYFRGIIILAECHPCVVFESVFDISRHCMLTPCVSARIHPLVYSPCNIYTAQADLTLCALAETLAHSF